MLTVATFSLYLQHTATKDSLNARTEVITDFVPAQLVQAIVIIFAAKMTNFALIIHCTVTDTFNVMTDLMKSSVMFVLR
jgi:hypothetical protein